MGLWDYGMMRLWDRVVLDTQVQGSEVTILLTLHSRFSAVFIGFPGIEFMALTSYGILRGFLRDMWPKLEYHNVDRLKFLCWITFRV